MTRFQFEDFIFDTVTHELHRDGTPVTIRPKTADLLCFFLENHPSLLSKEQLLREVWHDSYATEPVLFQTISDLRKVLGSSSRQPKFIQNLKKKGYRWCCEPVKLLPEVGVTAPSAAPEPETVAPPAAKPTGAESTVSPEPAVLASALRLGPAKRLIPAAMVLALVLPALWFAARNAQPPRPRRMVLLPFTNETGEPAAAWVALGLLNMVTVLINESSGLDVPNAADLPAALKVTGTVPPKPEDMHNLLTALELDAIVTTRVKKEADHYVLEFTTHSRAGRQTDRVRDGDLVRCAGLMSDRLAGFDRNEPIRSDPATTFSAVPAANQAYGMALQSMEIGELKAANLLFSRALDLDPSINWARIYQARCLEHLGLVRQGEQLTREALEAATLNDRYRQINAGLENMADIAGRRGELDREIVYRSKILDNPHGNLSARASLRARDALAFAHQQRGDLDKAAREYRTCLQSATTINYRQGIARAHERLSGLAYLQNHYKEAKKQGELALSLYRLLGNKWLETQALTKLGLIYERLGKDDEAVAAHQAALQMARRLQHKAGKIKACNNLGVYYFNRNEWEQAVLWYRQAYGEACNSQSPANQIPISFNLAEALLAADRAEEGRPYLQTCIQWFAQQEDAAMSLSIKRDALNILTAAYEQKLGISLTQ